MIPCRPCSNPYPAFLDQPGATHVFSCAVQSIHTAQELRFSCRYRHLFWGTVPCYREMKKNVFYFRIPESVDENFINDFENKLKWNEMQIS